MADIKAIAEELNPLLQLLLLLPVPQLVVLLLKRRLLSTLFSRAQVLLSSKLLRPLRNTAVSA